VIVQLYMCLVKQAVFLPRKWVAEIAFWEKRGKFSKFPDK